MVDKKEEKRLSREERYDKGDPKFSYGLKLQRKEFNG